MMASSGVHGGNAAANMAVDVADCGVSTQRGPSPASEPGDLISFVTTSPKEAPAKQENAENGTPERHARASADGTSNIAKLDFGVTDRVFPIRSVVSVDPTSTPMQQSDKLDNCFRTSNGSSQERRCSTSAASDGSQGSRPVQLRRASGSASQPASEKLINTDDGHHVDSAKQAEFADVPGQSRFPSQIFSDIVSSRSGSEVGNGANHPPSGGFSSVAERSQSAKSAASSIDESGPAITARFQHILSDGGHAILTGRDGEMVERCEDEPIHIPGAIQGFGVLVALQEEHGGKLLVRMVSENSRSILGYTPRQLFALDSFCDILSDEQTDNMLDHIDFIREDDADVATNGPEVFTLSIRMAEGKSRKLWCAIHINERNPGLIICEFELEDDQTNPLVPYSDSSPNLPEDTLQSDPTPEEFAESTQAFSRPLRILRSARKRKGEAAAMEVFNIMSQVQEQLAAAPNLQNFLKILVGVVKELTGFHRVMIYQFDAAWNGRVVTELVDPRATKDLYNGLHFPASDIPKQARELYKINKVRLLYDRDQETARLVCRTSEDLEIPLDLSYAYLRAMSPVHLKYLSNMAVRSSMSISINAFNELWGLIACHSYGNKGMRVSFPIRKMCRLVGDTASRNIERLSYASRLQARKLINTAPTQHNPSGYIIASSEDLLKLFDADFGILSIQDETKILGELEQSHEVLAMLEYLRMRQITSVITSQDITQDFPDLRYGPGFKVVAGMLLVPLSLGGSDFIVFFRKCQVKEVKWAGNPYEKLIKDGTEGYLEPRKSFKTWTERVVGKCRDWTEEEIETAAVLCLVYGKFIDVWRQKEAAMQNSQLTRLLLANSAHEVRTPLNAVINYLEIALEGSLDPETRENLAKSHSASKSLIYVINDLLDLTKTEEGGELIKGEIFDLQATLREVASQFEGDAKRKGLAYEIVKHPPVPTNVIGDQRKVRQAISNITANAIKHTTEGFVRIDMYLAARLPKRVEVEVVVQDSGVGMSTKKLDLLFMELEQVQSDMVDDNGASGPLTIAGGKEQERTLGLGLAVVARIIRNMNGQLRLKSEEGKGSRFVIQLPFDLPDSEDDRTLLDSQSMESATWQAKGEVTLVNRDDSRRGSLSGKAMSRRSSAESVTSKRSLKSFKSANSGVSVHSAGSDVDRLIEVLQEPHLVDPRSSGHDGRPSSRSSLSKFERHNRHSSQVRGAFGPERSRTESLDSAALPMPVMQPLLKPREPGSPGKEPIKGSGFPLKAIKVPEDIGSPDDTSRTRSGVLGEVQDKCEQHTPLPSPIDKGNQNHLRVLVAEDDPVNSKIVKKRLEKAGHEIHVTVNGEECATAFGDNAAFFDVVLMDMQMPIVDGLSSTKMIRSFEKSNPTVIHSSRASLNGRIPIIAVSASLIERDRQTYVDVGFDGWILKPISFPRLNELLLGIVDQKARLQAVYKPGEWERGGWFTEGQPDVSLEDLTPGAWHAPDRAAKPARKTAFADSVSGNSPKQYGKDEWAGRPGKEQKEDKKAIKSRSTPELRRVMSKDDVDDSL